MSVNVSSAATLYYSTNGYISTNTEDYELNTPLPGTIILGWHDSVVAPTTVWFGIANEHEATVNYTLTLTTQAAPITTTTGSGTAPSATASDDNVSGASLLHAMSGLAMLFASALMC